MFQGYFFCKPIIIARRDVPGHKINSLRILKEPAAEVLDFHSLKNIISHDPFLAFKLLRYINSTCLGLRHRVTSIKRVLEFPGEKKIKKQASTTVVMEFGRDRPIELQRLSVLSDRLAEILAGIRGFSRDISSLCARRAGFFTSPGPRDCTSPREVYNLQT